MPTSSSAVLLLGWDTPLAGAAPASSALQLGHALAAHTSLLALLPSVPAHSPAYPAPSAAVGLGQVALATFEEALHAQRQQTADATWQAPAAPYQGATLPPTPAATPAPPYQGATPPAAAPPTAVTAAPSAPPSQPEVLPAPAPELGAEPGLEEATDLLAGADWHPSENDLTDLPLTNEPAPQAEAEQPTLRALSAPAPDESAAAPEPPATPVVLWPTEEGALSQALAALRYPTTEATDLNFRVIQYARFATPLALTNEFGVIYATDWPTWLAALEIRQATGRPLVLHVTSLAQARATAHDQGWVQELERMALRRADLVLAATAELQERVHQVYRVPLSRLRVVAATETPEAVAHHVHEALAALARLA